MNPPIHPYCQSINDRTKKVVESIRPNMSADDRKALLKEHFGAEDDFQISDCPDGTVWAYWSSKVSASGDGVGMNLAIAPEGYVFDPYDIFKPGLSGHLKDDPVAHMVLRRFAAQKRLADHQANIVHLQGLTPGIEKDLAFALGAETNIKRNMANA